ncbi:MAG: restriction endonuclease [Anaerolineales bacterium]|nr:MAG: restriction endonuclease [Anaerolineales bacterium]
MFDINIYTFLFCILPLIIALTPLYISISNVYSKTKEEQRKIDADKEKAELKIQKEMDKLKAIEEKEARVAYTESRIQETAQLNQNTANLISDLENILPSALAEIQGISFESLYRSNNFRDLELPAELDAPLILMDWDEYSSKIQKPSFLEKIIPGWEERYQRKLEALHASYAAYKDRYKHDVEERGEKISAFVQEHESEKADFNLMVQRHNQRVEEFENAYVNGVSDAIEKYCSLVLENSIYPDGFPKNFKVAYVSEPRELVVEYELPAQKIVPAVAEYKYVKSRDAIDAKNRKPQEIKMLYQEVLSSICLRTIYELFDADKRDYLDVVVFNGFVKSIDPAVGKEIQPYLISVRAIKSEFAEINLDKIDRQACLRRLGAQVSPQPDELLAVKPIVQFDMVDKRFVDETDIISGLDTRQNLMDLNPFEFENLVNNLFSKMGFEAKLTRSSRDGGIDVVAFDPRPILGGKVVIQAKRYKNVVGVSAVRDLYGSMINEGAGKGILVTTSHYGVDAYSFANDKPIELIDGRGLLYLLNQNGYKAKIIFPQD